MQRTPGSWEHPDCILNCMGYSSALIPVRWVGGNWWSKGETWAWITQEVPLGTQSLMLEGV